MEKNEIGQTELTKIRTRDFGRSVDRTCMFGRPNPVRNRKKLRRFKGQLAPFGHFLALNLSQAPKGNVPDPVETSLISSKPNLVRESREREREASELS